VPLLGLGRGADDDLGVDFWEVVGSEGLSRFDEDEEDDVFEGLGDGLATLFVGTVTVIFFRVVFGFALPNMTVLCMCFDPNYKRRDGGYHVKERKRWEGLVC